MNVSAFVFVVLCSLSIFAAHVEKDSPEEPVVDKIQPSPHAAFDKIRYSSSKQLARILIDDSWRTVCNEAGDTPTAASIHQLYEDFKASDLTKVIRFAKQSAILQQLIDNNPCINDKNFSEYQANNQRVFVESMQHSDEKSFNIAKYILRSIGRDPDQTERHVQYRTIATASILDLLVTKSKAIDAFIATSNEPGSFADALIPLFVRHVFSLTSQESPLCQRKAHRFADKLAEHAETKRVNINDDLTSLLNFVNLQHYRHHLTQNPSSHQVLDLENEEYDEELRADHLAFVIRAVDLHIVQSVTIHQIMNFETNPYSVTNESALALIDFSRRLTAFVSKTIRNKNFVPQKTVEFWHRVHTQLVRIADLNGAVAVAMGIARGTKQFETFQADDLIATGIRKKKSIGYRNRARLYYEQNRAFIPAIMIGTRLATKFKDPSRYMCDKGNRFDTIEQIFLMRWALQKLLQFDRGVDLYAPTLLKVVFQLSNKQSEFRQAAQFILPAAANAKNTRKRSKSWSKRLSILVRRQDDI